MANLVSPGISVTITDESFFIPAAAATVPLIFIATGDEKKQVDGLLDAPGTFESNVIRTVTSVKQSLELYGLPNFIESIVTDHAYVAHHGDARNEYGLFALNQFLGIGSRAFVVRADVNLNDDLSDVRTMWDRKIVEASEVLIILANNFIAEVNNDGGFIPSTPGAVGYQEANLNGTGLLTTELNLPADATFDFSVIVDGEVTPQNLNLGLTTTSTIADVVSGMSNLILRGTVSLVDGNLRISSDQPGVGSSIVLTRGTPGTSGYQDINLSGSDGLDLIGAPAGAYVFDVTIDGTLQVGSVTLTGTDTVASLVSSMNIAITSGNVTLVAGDIRVTSNSTGTTSTVNLAMAGDLATSGSQVISFSPLVAEADLAGPAAGTYVFDATVDGTPQTVSVTALGGDTVASMIGLISTALNGASAVFEGGNIKVISDTDGSGSSVLMTQGPGATAGTQNMGFNVAAGDSVVLVPNIYDINIAVDGGAYDNVTIEIVGAIVFSDLVTLLDTAFTTATVTLVGTDIVVTSNTSGATSTISLSAGTNLDLLGALGTVPVTAVPGTDSTDLLSALTGFDTILTAVAGLNSTNLLASIATYLSLFTPVAGDTNDLFSSIPGFFSISDAVAGTASPYKTTLTEPEFESRADDALSEVFASFSFKSLGDLFKDDATNNPLDVFSLGYDQLAQGEFIGLDGLIADWVANAFGSTIDHATEFTPNEAADLVLAAADDFKYTAVFKNGTSLGANDAARRVAITQALSAMINGNQEIRSENFEYNLILCPGYPEIADEMVKLVAEIMDEAFVIAETPMNLGPSDIVAWGGTTARQSSPHCAYYYPHSLASNIDGKDVLAAASGTALRTIVYSDNVSELWFAPAGTRRGLVTGVTDIGYAMGNLGSPTLFAEVHLNLGQRDDLYKYFTNINPIVFFPGRGIIIWGQKTSSPAASALDRISVSRMTKYIKRQLRKNTMSFVFEPNDQLTRDNLKAAVDGFLGDLVVKRGLYDFATVCDDSNNTPDRIDRNELYVDIAIKPVKAAEFIYIPIRIVSTGADI